MRLGCGTLRSTRLGVVVGLAALLFGIGVVRADTKHRQKPPLCDGGRFVVQNGPLLPKAPASEVDVVEVGGVPVTASTSFGCAAANLKGSVLFHATKKGTQVVARWRNCGGVKGTLKLTKGLIADNCSKLTGVFRGKGLKRAFEAALTACGDGFLDTVAQEECDPGGVPCATAGDPCTAQCTCVARVVPTIHPTTILCQSPAPDSMLTLAPGSALMFQGQAVHPVGIATVTVNGTPVAVDADGSFRVPITSEFGINFVDVVATNTLAEASASTCTFLSAAGFAPEGDFLDDDVSLRFGQAAVDDNSRGVINSFGDILNVVLNSSGLAAALDDELNRRGSLQPYRCYEEFLGQCILAATIDYVSGSLSVPGPNGANLTLVDGGLKSSGGVGAISLAVRAYGQVVGIPYDTTGSIDVDGISFNWLSDVFMAPDNPTVPGSPKHLKSSLRDVNISVGSISTSFSGLDGRIINAIVTLANGTVRDLLVDQVATALAPEFNGDLAKLLGGVTTFPPSFDVPRIGEPGTITLNLADEVSSVAVDPDRALLGLRTRTTVAPGHAIASLGIALPEGALLRDSGGLAPLVASLHTGAINQVLHALWRGGLFHATLDAASLPDVPPGTVAQIETRLPPVVTAGAGSEVDLRVGAVHVTLTVPGLLDEPVSFTVGGEVSATVAVVDNALQLTDATIGGLHIGAMDMSPDDTQLAIIQSVERVLLQRLHDSVAGGVTGAVPIPRVPIPADLLDLGFPAVQFTITEPAVASVPPHFDLSGGFGIR